MSRTTTAANIVAATALIFLGWKICGNSLLTKITPLAAPIASNASSRSAENHAFKANGHGMEISYKQNKDYSYQGTIYTEDGRTLTFSTNTNGTFAFNLDDGNRFIADRDGQQIIDATPKDAFSRGTYRKSADLSDTDFPKICGALQTLGL